MKSLEHCGWQRKQAKLVNIEIESLLTCLSGTTGICNVLIEPLAGVRRGANVEAGLYKPWFLLPLVVCEAISGYYACAVPASAALQLFIAAAEVFDDIEDADAPGSLAAKHGIAVATNIATALLILAERAITRLRERGIEDHVIVRIFEVVNSFYATACAGQHLDLSLTRGEAMSEELYIKVASMKSASTTECGCQIGAILASADQEVIDFITLYGHDIGIASQIANDIRGITNGCDIDGRKVTLPVVYALAHTEGEAHNQLERVFSERFEFVPDLTKTRDLLFRCGAIHYAMTKMEIYKQHALGILNGLEKTGANVEKLRLFLE